MSSLMRIIALAITFVTLAIIAVVLYVFQLKDEMSSRIARGWFTPPIEYFSAAEPIEVQQHLTVENLRTRLTREHDYIERRPEQRLAEGDFKVLAPQECNADHQCVAVFRRSGPFGFAAQEYMLEIDSEGRLERIQPDTPSLELEPKMFAQFYGDQLILRDILPLGAVPLVCLQAVTAIEDSEFLQHNGVSFTGTLRAVVRNLVQGRFAEGGSTITQQLVKNSFLTHKKTLKRKVNEQLMALLLESQFDKDQILQTYLNEIYMGQNGPFEIHGFGAASRHYFRKPVGDLSLSECALLAALINSPGRYSPFTHPEASLKRRQLVLDRMEKLEMISSDDKSRAQSELLPNAASFEAAEPAPYVVQALNKELAQNDLHNTQGLRVLTSVRPQAQHQIQNLLKQHVEQLERQRSDLKAAKASGRFLQAAAIAVDIRNGAILAVIGGRDYRQTQLNRIFESQRQVGSTMKPFVYLTALENGGTHGETYTPLSELRDEATTFRFQGQTWSPRNYDQKFRGKVPFYYALKESLNLPTAALGLSVGLGNVIELARRLGIESTLQPLPSLTLGAFELRPIELTQSYTCLARMGDCIKLRLLLKVEDQNAVTLLDQAAATAQQQVDVNHAAVLLGLLRQTFISGTARAARIMGFEGIAAGKTGTTSDMKDAWFVGTTNSILTLVWIGYDDNAKTGLTGASGALPLWVQIMKTVFPAAGSSDFAWPSTVQIRHVDGSTLAEKFDTLPETEKDGADLVFGPGQ